MTGDGRGYLVSALVSTYNAEQYLAGCLESLEAQTIAGRMEIIVVNSGSLQNEEEIVREFQERYRNIRYIKTEQRETIYAAWNRAIKISRGRYITNANTDDRLVPEALETLTGELEKHPDRILAYANQRIVRPQGSRKVPVGEGYYGYYTRQRLLSRELDVGSQPLWRRSLHDEFGYFDEMFFVAGDTELWLRASQKYRFLYVNRILGERLFRHDGVWLSEKDGLSDIEKTILLNCYHYAMERHMMIDERGISGTPLFSDWYEINLWKQRVNNKISGRQPGPGDCIKRVHDDRKGSAPRLTVVVVTWNRFETLMRCLMSLRAQTEQDFEVIVVNNGGEFLERAERLTGVLQQGLCCIDMNQNMGVSRARNTALSFSRAGLVAFLDDDALAHEGFTGAVLRHFTEHDLCGLRGRILPDGGGLSPAPCDLGDRTVPAACDTAGCSAFKKEVLQVLGGFNEDLQYYEGSELSYRIYRSRDRDVNCILYFPDVIVYHDYEGHDDHLMKEGIRRRTAEKMLSRRDPELAAYLQFMDGFYSQKRYDVTYRKYISWSAMYEEKDPARAMHYVRSAIESNPFEHLGYFHLGSLYLSTGEPGKARGMFEKTCAILEQLAAGEPEKLLALRNRKELDDCYVSACTRLAQACASLNEHEQAAAVLTKLLQSEFFHTPPHKRKEIRDWLDRFKEVGKGQKASPADRAEAFNSEGETCFLQGDIGGALRAFTKAIESAPGHATGYNNLGVVHWQEGNVDLALEYFQRALAIDPDNRDAVLNRAKILASLQDAEGARKLFRGYLERHPDDKEMSELAAGL